MLGGKVGSEDAAWGPKPWEMPRFRNWIAVARVYQLVCKSMTEALASLDLKLPHYDILATIARWHDLSQQELANRLLVGRSNLSMLLPELEARGLVERVPDAQDKRVRRLRLTPKGKALTLKAIALHVAVIERMMSVCSEDECDAVGDAMRRMRAELLKTP
ncbi:MAG: MarR family transcriptional regulator [Beijerinckiaceae bacterium]